MCARPQLSLDTKHLKQADCPAQLLAGAAGHSAPRFSQAHSQPEAPIVNFREEPPASGQSQIHQLCLCQLAQGGAHVGGHRTTASPSTSRGTRPWVAPRSHLEAYRTGAPPPGLAARWTASPPGLTWFTQAFRAWHSTQGPSHRPGTSLQGQDVSPFCDDMLS